MNFVLLPVRAAGLATVLYWLLVDMMLWRGLRGGEETMANSSIIRLPFG